MVSNDRMIKQGEKRQVNKLQRLIVTQGISCNDPKKVIFNFSDYALNDHEESVLGKGLNFSHQPKAVVNKMKISMDEKNLRILV